MKYFLFTEVLQFLKNKIPSFSLKLREGLKPATEVARKARPPLEKRAMTTKHLALFSSGGHAQKYSSGVFLKL
jgi:hypothetical protein